MALDVLIPHYRDLDGFTASLNSIVEQTWSGDIRLVVVDDGSPENEFLALRRHLDKQPLPFHLERNDANRGRPYTRNRLLDCIDSDYVAWQDAGDLWYPEKIARQFEHISRLRFASERLLIDHRDSFGDGPIDGYRFTRVYDYDIFWLNLLQRDFQLCSILPQPKVTWLLAE